MSWKVILNRKRNETLIFTSIVLLIAMIGFMNKKHIAGLKESITSIYEDRLVAKAYLFDLSQKISAKKVMLNTNYTFVQKSLNENQSINQLIKDYERTKLTEQETELLARLKSDIHLSYEFENQILHNPGLPNKELVINSLSNQYDLILIDLKSLSEIQLLEGKKLLDSSNHALAFNSLTGQLEIVLLIVVALVFLMAITSQKILIEQDWWSTKKHLKSFN